MSTTTDTETAIRSTLGVHYTDDPSTNARTLALIDRLRPTDLALYLAEGIGHVPSDCGNALCQRCDTWIDVPEADLDEAHSLEADPDTAVAYLCFHCSGIVTDLIGRDLMIAMVNDLIALRENFDNHAAFVGYDNIPDRLNHARALLVRAQNVLVAHLDETSAR